MSKTAAPLFFLIAGETSGDLLGARLMHALKTKLNNNVRFAGIGGPRMVNEGLDVFFPQAELAHFGVFELFRHIPHILKRIRQTIAEIKRLKPAALITIDAPDFSFRVAKKLKGVGIPLIHYVAPTVWAWRPGRAEKIAEFLDHLLVLLPFEPPYFIREGLGCTFVGHPIVESGAEKGDAGRFRARFGIGAEAPLLAVLPGSRRGEISRLMPVFGEAMAKLKTRHRDLRVVIPAAPGFTATLKDLSRDWLVPVTITESDRDKYDAFAASRAALACSGTVALELAMACLPAVIAYKISALTYAAFRRLIKVKYVNLVNLMHDRPVVPELLQSDCTADKLADAVDKLLSDESARQRQKEGLADVATWLGYGQFVTPSERAADTVLRLIRDRDS
jgi:lipid-A-disaccharide synthase